MIDRGEYNPTDIEAKWRERWAQEGLYKSVIRKDQPKHYALTMLPYPSGNLHIGHWYAMVPSDARARYYRLRGYNVMFPMGFDAFGLPAENAAIKNNVHPKSWTFKNIDYMRNQLKSMGNMIDWDREAISADEKYYKWTQWFFLKLYEHGLAYRKKSPVDWCPNCNTTLAREQVWGDDRHCERCRTPVIKKDLTQWFFRTTRYAEELLSFDGIDWPERVKTLQSHWIGRSEGAEVHFTTESGEPLSVFTTRPDTLWGVTYMALAPEHPLVEKLTTPDRREAVEAYKQEVTRQTDIERKSAEKVKTGVFTGAYAINPVSGDKLPIWVADYVLMGYGTGALMAVPGHDQRDFEFAKTYGLEIRQVILAEGQTEPGTLDEPLTARGTMVNSGAFSGTPGNEANSKVIDWLESKGLGKKRVNYNLHDWLISRQRYWGCPIPMVFCDGCGTVPVAEQDLPVTLPEDVAWRPTGESPLKLHDTWRKLSCPKCGGPAERETDTMDTFMCSSWYHLRYLSPNFDQGPFDPEEYAYWMPVDTYTGGIEHATMHLIYTRFFHKACRDMGIQTGDEPMVKLFNQGIILGEDNEKMSKSRGNVVDPDALVREFGADTVRAYLMFVARWEQGGPWNSSGIAGAARWLRRVWTMFTTEGPSGQVDDETVASLRRKLHQTLDQVGRELERFQFNTCIAALMELYSEMARARDKGASHHAVWAEVRRIYLTMLAPFCPHLAEELWRIEQSETSVHASSWPEVDADAAKDDVITLIVQVNGKVRDKITVPANIAEADARETALASEIAQRFLEGLTVRKVIVIPGRLVNIVAN